MSVAASAAVAVTFVWLGMVVAISFIEAPLKFRAPDVTVRIGLGIGRMVFRALNTVEVVLAASMAVALVADSIAAVTSVALGVAVLALATQLSFVRPRLTRRSDAILAGREAPRSSAHHVYIALEAIKVLALLIGGITALAAA